MLLAFAMESFNHLHPLTFRMNSADISLPENLLALWILNVLPPSESPRSRKDNNSNEQILLYIFLLLLLLFDLRY